MRKINVLPPTAAAATNYVLHRVLTFRITFIFRIGHYRVNQGGDVIPVSMPQYGTDFPG